MSSQRMTQETPAKRTARLALERKQAQRKREKDKKVAMGVSKFKMEMYSGTRSELELIRMAGDFDETEHALTIAIHALAELSRSDPAAFRVLMQRRGK
jgi:hypothetical protein